jgi:hypothetical protein
LLDWAINIANEMGISNFQASGTWNTRFKQAHHIGSRKITKFVSRNYAVDEAMIEQSIKDFLASTKLTIASYERCLLCTMPTSQDLSAKYAVNGP